MTKARKLLIVLTTVCLSMLIFAGSALATPAWKGHPNEKNNKKPVKSKVTIQLVDVKGHWAEQNIIIMNTENVIKGYEDRTFQPNKPVNKEEAITMIVRMIDGENVGNTLLSNKSKNAKGVSLWARQNLNLAVEKGILSEVELNTLAFNKPAQRYEVTVWLVRALGLEDKAIENAGADLDFRDESAIPAWARGYVKVAVDEEIITGFPGHVFKPGAPVTRAEMATMLVRTREGFDMPSPRQGFSFIRGKVKDVDDGDNPSITIQKANRSGEIKVDISEEAFVYLDGKEADLSDVEQGDMVSLLVDSEREAIVVMARTTGDSDEDDDEDNDEDSDEQSVEGIVESISSSSITVKVDGNLKVYALDEDVDVEVDGKDADLEDIEKGYEVELTVEDDKVIEIEADSVDVKVEISGTVESVSNDKITVKVDGDLRVYNLSEGVDVELDGEEADVQDLEQGYEVDLTLEDGEVIEIEATSETVSGVLESVGSSSITVKVDGGYKVYNLDSDVEVIIDDEEEGLADLDKGMDVELTFDNNKVVKIEAE